MLIDHMYSDAVFRESAKELLLGRDMDLGLLDELPCTGIIVIDTNPDQHTVTPIAMGFLRMVEGSYAMLDSYITNPLSTAVKRNEALDVITSGLLRNAADRGISKVISFTSDAGIADRCRQYKFEELPYSFFTINPNKPLQ